MPSRNGYAIRTSGLTRDFGTIRALDQLTLDVPSGIVFGFLGPNGSGKTTTIRLLLGLLEPSAGRAEVLGNDVASAADRVRNGSGALLEHTGLYERMTAEDNLEFHARAALLPAAERRARIRELLTNLALWDRRRDLVGGWSRGMKQKLAVARALLHRPRLVFLDEPMAGLDPVAAAALREDLAALVAREKVTVFLTTHNLLDAERLCAQVAVVRTGKLLAVGPPRELASRASDGRQKVEIRCRSIDDRVVELLRAQPGILAVTRRDETAIDVEVPAGASTSPLVSLIVSAGAEVEEVKKLQASLEEAFLDLVADDESAGGAPVR